MEWRFPGKIPISAVQACISFAHMIASSGECPVKFADAPERGLIASVHQMKEPCEHPLERGRTGGQFLQA
jgi:hypothetical protein